MCIDLMKKNTQEYIQHSYITGRLWEKFYSDL